MLKYIQIKLIKWSNKQMQEKVLAFARLHPEGFIDNDLDRSFGAEKSSYRVARIRLCRDNKLRDSGTKRKIAYSNRNAHVWTLNNVTTTR